MVSRYSENKIFLILCRCYFTFNRVHST